VGEWAYRRKGVVGVMRGVFGDCPVTFLTHLTSTNGSNPAHAGQIFRCRRKSRRGHLRKLRRALVLRLGMSESMAAT
jgi:hypothetical protein